MVDRVGVQVLKAGAPGKRRQSVVVAHGVGRDVVEPPDAVQRRHVLTLVGVPAGRIDGEAPGSPMEHEAVEAFGALADGREPFIERLRQGPVAPVHREVVDALVGPEVREVVRAVQLHDPVSPPVPGVDEVGAGHSRDDGLQCRMPARDRRPLRVAVVGVAPHADGAVRPGLRGYPVERVVAVLDLVHERQRLALGAELAAHVLHDERVAAVGHERGDLRHERVAGALVVGKPHEDGGQAGRTRRKIDVGGQPRAVAHGDHRLLRPGIERGGLQVVHLIRHAGLPWLRRLLVLRLPPPPRRSGPALVRARSSGEGRRKWGSRRARRIGVRFLAKIEGTRRLSRGKYGRDG